MSANWIKWCKGLSDKREVRVLASRFKRDRHEIAGRLMALWEWCDENIDDSDFVGDDAIVSLYDRDSVVDLVDGSTGIPGMLVALECPEVDWISVAPDGKTTFKNLARHNGKTAKERAAEQRKKAKQREKEAKKTKQRRPKPLPDGSAESVPEVVPVAAGLDERRREEDDRRIHTSPDVRNTKAESTVDPHRPPTPQSSKEVRDEFDQTPKADLAGLDWSHVVSLAKSAARKVPPLNDKDRRAWLRFAVLAVTACSEGWLSGVADSVARATNVRKTRQATFVAALKKKAAETWGYDEPTFHAMVRQIEIPTDVWKSPILEVRK